MRIDRSSFSPLPADGAKSQKTGQAKEFFTDEETFIDLPAASGIENKVSARELFQTENKKKIAELADKLGLDPSRLYNIQFLWLLNEPSTRAEAGEVLRRMLMRD